MLTGSTVVLQVPLIKQELQNSLCSFYRYFIDLKVTILRNIPHRKELWSFLLSNKY